MTSNKNWKHFERLVAAIHYAESQGAIITWDDKISGRQFDVTMKFKYGLHDYLTVIECKNHASKIAVEKVDALVIKARDIKANKAIMVSSSGYQSGCFEVANRHGVKLLTLNKRTEVDINKLIAEVTPALNVYNVRLKQTNSNEEYILEDEGGKLHYLMNQIKLESNGMSRSPNQVVHEWQLTKPDLSINSENTISLPLPSGTLACIPYEESKMVTAFLFKCKFIEAFVSKGPFLDNHMREYLDTTYELIDEAGEVTHEVSSSDLKIGFDTKLEAGKFYVNLNLHIYYYCKKIEGDTVSMVMVESYQHGNLVQATYEQEIKYSCHYVEVKDNKKLSMLRKLSKRFKRGQATFRI
ncbi:restriction endonuclease [Candidatus Pacearchaeota archaeon]|nr:restriction endonuclease [Candidatus Pacearchaeota archaeon]